MKFFKLDLLTLLISLFILNSCKNQDTIGLGVNAGNQLNGSLIDTSTIIVNTVPEDSVVTVGLAQAPMGLFRDPIFGTTESNMAMDLHLPGIAPYTLPTGTIVIDSALLVLRYGKGFYGDSLASRYKVNVYQLGERIYSGNAYYNTRQWKYNSSTLLGSQSFFSRTHDSIGIHIFIPGGKDSIQKVPPQLRVPISKTFINSILFNASASQLASDLVFKNNVNGLYITLDKTGTTGSGGTFMMQDSSHIDIYYRAINGTTIDTGSVSLPSNLNVSQIKHTYPAAIQTELSHTTDGSRNVFYLQGPAGLRTKISFPYLKNLPKSIGSDIVINRAELVITPNPGSTIPFGPLPQISLYQHDFSNQPAYLQDLSGDVRSQGMSIFGGYYSISLQNYHFVITAYISDLMHGTTVDYGTFLGAVDVATTASSAYYRPTAQTASRTFAIGTDKTSPYRIKLNIIYTKIAK